jgi:thioester reductase-like protein/SAM-dependent methyltransferase
LLAAGRPLAVLAREGDGVDARARVATALGGTPALERVEVVGGDLATLADTLGPTDLRRLRARVETVIHCAGDTSFAPAALAPSVAGHVAGPVALLRARGGRRLACWTHVFTAFVCGDRSGTIREADGDIGQRFHNVYERVKLEAETAIRAAGRAAGVEVRVRRPSIVVGAAPATAGGNPSNLFFAFIRRLVALARWPRGAAARLRIEAEPCAPFNIVPLAHVAEATAALAEHPAAAGGTFHLVVRDPPSQAAMLAMLVERLGVCGVTLRDVADASPADLSPMERRVARMLGFHRHPGRPRQGPHQEEPAGGRAPRAAGRARREGPEPRRRLDGRGCAGRAPAARGDPPAVMRSVEALLRRYARGQARDVAPWIVGARVLDLGAGEGFVTAALGGHGWRCAVDVGPFRRAAVPYVVYDGAALPFDEAAFDTTLLLLTLHHCDEVEAVLDEAVRVTRRRLIVTESVFRNPLDLFWLRALDGRFNRLRHGGRMAAPLAFRSGAEWEALFASRGLRMIAARWLGSRWERLVHHPRLYVLEATSETRTELYTTSSVRAVVSPKRPSA